MIVLPLIEGDCYPIQVSGGMFASSMGLVDLIVWLLVIELLSFAVLPYLMWMAPEAPDRGYALSKVIGVAGFGFLAWLPVVMGLIGATPLFITSLFALVLVLGYFGYRWRGVSLDQLRALLLRHALPVEGLFLGLTAIFALIRFLNPEIVWGEKPMDSTFLNFFIRNTSLPPQDPWAAGHPMTYYYMGIYFVAALLKLTGISGAVGYNLAISTLAGLIGVALYGLLLVLSRSRLFAALAAVVLVVASDPEVLRLCFIEGKTASFDTSFWASTRVFTSPGFLEYTGWSLLFADLHAHVVAIPFTVAVLGLGAILFVAPATRYSSGGAALRVSLGLLVGMLIGLNTWDLITFGSVVALLVGLAPVPPFWRPRCRADGSAIFGETLFAHGFARSVALVWDLILLGIGFSVPVLAYQLSTPLGERVGWGWVTATEFNSLSQFLWVLGFQCVALGVALVIELISCIWARKWPRIGALLFVVAGGAMVIAPPLISEARGNTDLPWAIFFISASIVAFSGIVWWNARESAERRVIALFGSAAAVLIVLLEVFYLMDRMNTLFKGYMAVWMLSGITAATGLFFAWQRSRKCFPRTLAPIALASAIVISVCAVIGGILNMKAVVMMQRVPTRHYTLNGSAYLDDLNRADYEVISWLNRNIAGTPTILEAQGESYREYTRIAMHTGLPTVLGWEYHVLQRGLSHKELLERKLAVRQIYAGYDLSTVRDLLQRYKVDFVVVSDLERRSYSMGWLEKFQSHPELFVPVVSFGNTHLYVTSFSPYRESLEARQNR